MLEQSLDVEEGHDRADKIERGETAESVNSKFGRKQQNDCDGEEEQAGHGKNGGRNGPEEDLSGPDFCFLPFNGEKFAAILQGAQSRAANFSNLGDETGKMIVALCHCLARLTSADLPARQ